jgi:hypothetical protein
LQNFPDTTGIRGRTVTLKVKFANFRQITRSRSGQTRIKTRSELEELGDALLEPLFPVTKGVRLLAVSLSSLAAEEAERERQPVTLNPPSKEFLVPYPADVRPPLALRRCQREAVEPNYALFMTRPTIPSRKLTS